MEISSNLKKAIDLLSTAKGPALSTQERQEKSITLASLMLNEANRIQTTKEKKTQAQLARMMDDPEGKIFTTSMTDQCFRTHHSRRIANQLNYLIKKYGVPKYLSLDKRIGLKTFQLFGQLFPGLFVPMTRHLLRKETSSVILPGEPDQLAKHMKIRREEGVRVNLNHLGEAILGEKEAKHRLHVYLDDLTNPEVEYISIKASTIFSQIHLLAWEDTIHILSERLKQLYRTAKNHIYTRLDGSTTQKFVNLDMEEYRDLEITVDVFQRVLEDPEFFNYSAGIVLQSYLPDSYLIQQKLTVWAMQRLANGGAPIKIRIVKGANLAMEQVESALKEWPQAPYTHKSDVDANYKRMIEYGSQLQHAKAANLGIASHNLFDIAYAMILRSENQIEEFVCFEMLEGMADHIRRVVQALSHDMLLYCPAATKEEFQNAVAYLVRRLDENTAPENFLRHAFHLFPGTKEWENQARFFSESLQNASKVSSTPRRYQNRNKKEEAQNFNIPFINEADTDWSLTQNRKWAENILKEWSQKTFPSIPLIIGGQIIHTNESESGEDPSFPGKGLYDYSLAGKEDINKALEVAEKTQRHWGETSTLTRCKLLSDIAYHLRLNRDILIGAMIADTGKTVYEADVEVSEAIDFADYYAKSLEEFSSMKDIQWSPKGVTLVAPPWNFPASIPAGGILAALAAGNTVIFKPASEAILVGWELAKIFWNAGISQEVLQFLTCEDEPIGSQLIQDPRIQCVILTGATATAKHLLKLRPGLDLIAETGGKNAIIVSNLSDRDLAIKDIIQSAFGHAGQKCSACSLVILEKEVYDDAHFLQQLQDAAASLRVSSPWDPAAKINPLIHYPNSTLLRGLTQLDKGETWLLQPKQDVYNPNLWSPGIKLGVKEGSFSHQNEFFGPLISVMRANNLEHAMTLANGTSYGLTSGLHSLDDREQKDWMEHIEAGNLYINRGITGAIVQRQPFGGTKESSFGRGSKAGGPNYISQLMHAETLSLPEEQDSPPSFIQIFAPYIEEIATTSTQIEDWKASVGSYVFYWNHYFSQIHDPSLVLGQDNLLKYIPHKKMTLRIQKTDQEMDVLRVVAACLICQTPLEISSEESPKWLSLIPNISFKKETEAQFIERIVKVKRIRTLSPSSQVLIEAFSKNACNVLKAPVLANGRLELLNYLREVSISIDYHRYGNLGEREDERRAPLVESQKIQTCCGSGCACRC